MTDVAPEQARREDAVHEHGWLAESGHQTSEGRVVYVRCAGCGVRRVDLQPHPLLPPEPLSRGVVARRRARPSLTTAVIA